MLALQLALLSNQEPFACDVHLIESRPVPGPGLAYTARRPEYLLNVRTEALSAFPAQPDHFANWLRVTQSEPCQHGFCSRQSYGRYLQQLIGQVLEWPSTNGIRCQWHNQTATGVHVAPDGKTATVRLTSGAEIRSDYVVLALGNFPPAPPAHADLRYLTRRNYHGNPWARGALREIGLGDSVLLIGTGLTAIDVLLGLRADGHHGPITVVSGHGRWPAAHLPAEEAYPSFYATRLAHLTRVADVLRAVRQQIQEAAQQGIGWRPVIDSLRPDLGRIWGAWSLAEQGRFLRHLAGIWSVVRHRSPPQNAAAVQQMLDSGLVRLEKGRIRAIEPVADQLVVSVQTGSGQPPRQLTARHVVTCTGPLLDYSRISTPLVVGLREAGHLVPDALRLGIQTDADGALLNAQGEVSSVLFTIGASRRPAGFESTAVPELRNQATELARELGQRLRMQQ